MGEDFCGRRIRRLRRWKRKVPGAGHCTFNQSHIPYAVSTAMLGNLVIMDGKHNLYINPVPVQIHRLASS